MKARDITVLEFEYNGKVVFRGSCSPDKKEIERYVVHCFTRFLVPVRSKITARRFTWVVKDIPLGKCYAEPHLMEVVCLVSP